MKILTQLTQFHMVKQTTYSVRIGEQLDLHRTPCQKLGEISHQFLSLNSSRSRNINRFQLAAQMHYFHRYRINLLVQLVKRVHTFLFEKNTN